MWVNRERYEKEQKLLRIIDLAFPMMVENAKRLVDGDYPTGNAVMILRNELGGRTMRPIDADALKTKINTTFFSGIGQIIDDAPTVELKEQLEALPSYEIKSMTVTDLAVLADRLNMELDIRLTPLSKEEPNENNQTEL